MARVGVMHIAGCADFAGAEKHILTLVDNMDGARFETSVVCPYAGRLAEDLRAKSVRTFVVDMRSPYRCCAFSRLAAIMRSEHVQIVHSHGPKSDFYTRVSRRLAGVPIHVSTVHNSICGIHPFRRWPHFSFYKLSICLPDKLICVSEAVADELVNSCKMNPERTITVHNGVDTDRFDPVKYDGSFRSELEIEEGAPIIGIIAKMVLEKGHLYLLQAMAEVVESFPEARCVLVGDGPIRERLERTAHTLEITDRCIFTGVRSDIPQLLSILDISVMPSVSEAISIALMESMAMAKPVVATKVGGIPELVKDGVTGLLVPPKDPLALKEAIIALLTDRRRAREMGRRGRELVLKRFDQRLMIRRIETLYQRLLEEKRH